MNSARNSFVRSKSFEQYSSKPCEPQSVFQLLDQAVQVEDSDKRFTLIVKACKIITDVLPLESRVVILYQQRDLLFYLIALEAYHPKVISEILNMFVEKVPEYTGFIPVFYESILEIARCPEPFYENAEQKYTFNPRILEYNVHSPRMGVSNDIISRMHDIKSRALHFLEAFTKERFKVICTEYRPLDFLKICLAFFIHTRTELIIRKACQFLHTMVDDKFGALLVKDLQFAQKIIEASKKGSKHVRKLLFHIPISSAFPRSQKNISPRTSPRKIQNDSNLSLLLTMSPLPIIGPLPLSEEVSEGQYARSEDMSPDLRILHENEKKHGDLSLDFSLDNENMIPEVDDEANMEVDDLKQYFEDWLLNNEKPAINQNQVILEYFNRAETYQEFFTIMLDPFECECSARLFSLDDMIVKEVEDNKEKMLGPFFNSIDLEGGDGISKTNFIPILKHSYVFIYRAYKYQQILLDHENWNQIKTLKPNFISEFYMRFHQAIRKKSSRTSINLATELVDFFIKQDPDQSIVNIIHYNIPFILMWNVDIKKIQELLCNLVNLAENHYKLNLINLIKLCRYYRYTDFFNDYVKLIYDGHFTPDIWKCAINYKPPSLYKIYQMNQNFMTQIQNKARRSSRALLRLDDNITGSKKSDDRQEDEDHLLLVEEKLHLKSDIDGIKNFLPIHIGHPEKSHFCKEHTGQNDKRAQSVPRLHFNRIVECKPVLSYQPDEIKIESHRSSAAIKNESYLLDQGSKPIKLYPSMLEAAIKAENLQAGDKIMMRRNSRTPQESRFPANRSSVRVMSGFAGRRNSKISENVPPETLIEQFLNTHRLVGEISRPGTSAARPINQLFTTRSDFNSINTSFVNTEEEMRRTKRSEAKLPSVREREWRNKRIDTRESNRSSIGIESMGALGSLSSIAQSVTSIYSLPSKALGKPASGPKFCCFKQNQFSVDEEEWLGKQELNDAVIKANEKRAYTLAVCLENLIREFFQRYQQDKLMKAIGMRDLIYVKLIKALEGSCGIAFFSLMLKNFLQKMVKSTEDFESSGLVCGHIVNEFISRIYKHPALNNVSNSIHQECCMGVSYLSRIIAASLSWKSKNKLKVYLQNHVVHESLGSNRLLLIRTLYYIILNDAAQNFAVVNKVSEQCWQAFVFWFTELKHQNMFQNLALKIFEVGFKHGSEELVLLLLLKANILSPLLVAYHDVFQNGFLMKKFHIDSFIRSIKLLVSYVEHVETQRKELIKAQEILSKLQSWIELKKQFINKDPFTLPSCPKDESSLPSSPWSHKESEPPKVIKIKGLLREMNQSEKTPDGSKSDRNILLRQGKRVIVKAKDPNEIIREKQLNQPEHIANGVKGVLLRRTNSEEKMRGSVILKPPQENLEAAKARPKSVVRIRRGVETERQPSVKRMLV